MKTIEALSKKSIKKEVSTMKTLKLMMVVNIIFMLTVGFGMIDAQAAQQYTPIGTPVAVTASGTLSGSIVSLSMSVVTQGTGASVSAVSFSSPAGLTNSTSALKITGGTNDVDARLIVYTDNTSYFSTGNDPAIDNVTGKPTGIDGAGMPGQTNVINVTPLLWGVTSNADFSPNTNPVYSFASDLSNAVYVTDLRHTYDFVTQKIVDAINTKLVTTYTIDQIDTITLYRTDGTAGPANTASEGVGDVPKLVPTLFKESLWDSANTSSRRLIREALYRNIATIAYNIRTPDSKKTDETGSYICNVPNLLTAGTSVRAKLAKYGTGTTDNYLYIPIAGDFSGQPAQIYSTAKLTVAMVKY